MEINIKKIGTTQQEYVEIGCHREDERVEEIARFVKSRQGSVEGYLEKKQYKIPLTDLYYIESVDDKTYLCSKEECYETRKRLYELESELTGREFIRISKSVIVNMMKITAIKPALNGRFLCQLNNGEKVIISRKYVADVKERLKK